MEIIEERVMYLWGLKKSDGSISLDNIDVATTINGELDTTGAPHINTLLNDIRLYRDIYGYKIVFDENHYGDSISLPRNLKSKLQEALA